MKTWSRAALCLLLVGAPMPERVASATMRLAAELGRLRDIETGRHNEHVAKYVAVYASAIRDDSLTPDLIAHLELIASAHDLGKIGIPDSILQKPGRLTDGEMAVVRAHTTNGSAIVERLITDLDLENWPYVMALRGIVRSHHEHFDGSGYPDGLRGKSIPLAARILSVADVYDALITGRPYKRAWDEEEALSYLVRQQGSQFDDLCVAGFVERFSDILEAKRAFADILPSSRHK